MVGGGGFGARFPNRGGRGPKKSKPISIPAKVVKAKPSGISIPAPLVPPVKQPKAHPAPPQSPPSQSPPAQVTLSAEAPSDSPPRRLEGSHEFMLSILIPTLTARAELLSKLLNKLATQIESSAPGGKPDVEVVISEDNGEQSVGAKRNYLLNEATGVFVVFVDDDDEISDDYVFQIRNAILEHPDVDCIGMRAIMTTGGKYPRPVVYSRSYPRPETRDGMYLRPPQHLTPIRRSIAVRHRFPDLNLGEDALWAKSLYNDIKTEHFVDKVLYHYKFEPGRTATQGNLNHAPVTGDNYSIVIPSARAENLVPCVKSILAMEPTLSPDRIIVVDDGARAVAESHIPGVKWVTGVKPFCFSRNVNLGIKEAPGDVIIMNDDAQLQTKFGMASMSYAVRSAEGVGVCSAAITGFVGNPNQQPVAPTGLRQDPRMVAFICVYIPRAVLDALGILDERFVGYGFDDDDYCRRVMGAGLRVMICDGCVVRHGEESGTSTFRTKSEIHDLFTQNRKLFEEKWGSKS